LEQDFKREAVRHAEQEHPKEAAGLVVNGGYFPCRNIAPDPENNFVINPVDYARAMLIGTVEAVVHSHPQGTPVSDHDRKACRQTKLPWYVYSVPDKQWSTIKPS
jgi:proteasome lid subunit RPN8/RPN11